MSNLCCDDKVLCAAAIIKSHELFRKAAVLNEVIGKELLDCFEEKICDSVRTFDAFLKVQDKAEDLNKCGISLVDDTCGEREESCLNCDSLLKEVDAQNAALEDAKHEVCRLLKELVNATENLQSANDLANKLESNYLDCIHDKGNDDCGC